MMKPTRFFKLTSLLAGAAIFAISGSASLRAADAPTITISKSDKLNIAIAQVGDAATTRVVSSDLALSGYFTVVPTSSAKFVVSGSQDGALRGKVVDRGGKIVLSQSFSGSPRGQAHQFADAIIETLTGHPGFASGKIAFVSARTGHKEIYTADFDGSNLRQLTHDKNISVGPKLSADGARLLYTGYLSGYADVYEIKFASGERRHLIKYPGTNTGAVFAPHDGRIAVTLSKDGNPELYVIGGGAHRLTHTRGIEASPTWSPDGSEIIYTYDDNSGPQLYRISASGGSAQHIATGYGYCTEPNWSPDGKKIAYTVRSGGGFQIAVTDLTSGHSSIICGGQTPAWGADSRHLICAYDGGLYLVDVPTGRKTRLLANIGGVSEPSWSR